MGGEVTLTDICSPNIGVRNPFRVAIFFLRNANIFPVIEFGLFWTRFYIFPIDFFVAKK